MEHVLPRSAVCDETWSKILAQLTGTGRRGWRLLKRLLQGAAAGAVATIFVGFYWGGWSLGSTADKMAKQRSELAVVTALAPVCADKFRALADSDAKKVALSKIDSWKRRDKFPKELVTLPGESYPNSALVDACYTLLLAPKSAALK